MVQLPGSLHAAALGDVLAALHRGAVTGDLLLLEERGQGVRVHRIEWRDGLILDVAGPEDGGGGRARRLERLRIMERLGEVHLRFSVMKRRATRMLPLRPEEFLKVDGGRRNARAGFGPAQPNADFGPAQSGDMPTRQQLKAALRRAAFRYHPDRAGRSAAQQAAATRQFIRIVGAYEKLLRRCEAPAAAPEPGRPARATSTEPDPRQAETA